MCVGPSTPTDPATLEGNRRKPQTPTEGKRRQRLHRDVQQYRGTHHTAVRPAGPKQEHSPWWPHTHTQHNTTRYRPTPPTAVGPPLPPALLLVPGPQVGLRVAHHDRRVLTCAAQQQCKELGVLQRSPSTKPRCCSSTLRGAGAKEHDRKHSAQAWQSQQCMA